jgi:mannosylglycoprotein endo-beta-mannosidase
MNDQILDSGWVAQKASALSLTGSEISAANAATANWMPAVVPGTVLTTLVHNGVYPDPYYGTNNAANVIPDIYNVGRDFYTYWFSTTFELPALPAQSRAWLKLRGINYSADVYLNGVNINQTLLQGMFLRHAIDFTGVARFGGSNNLAIIVYPVDHPGDVANGGQGGDHQIAQDVTAQYVAGWDWMIPIRDRNTGIWDQVAVGTSGPVALRDPHVITTLPNGAQGPAVLAGSATLVNASTVPQRCTLGYVIEGTARTLDVTLSPSETREVALPTLTITNPRLWWPNGMGAQERYTLDLSVTVAGYGLSDRDRVDFGIREITSYLPAPGRGRIFQVNGQPVFLRGGNWIASDGMLRFSTERYRAEVRFHAQMNLNMIRVWGGSIAERPEFYAACDAFGLLVMQEFWMTGDNNGTWGNGNPTWPLDHQLYIACAADTVKRLRNHPSLCFWCGGNELNPTFQPPADIEAALTQTIMPTLDGTRLYVPSSLSPDDGLGPGDGPYGILAPAIFYTNAFADNPFNPEIGSIGTPNVETLRRFLPQAALDDFPRGTVAGPVWTAHTYIPYANPQQGVPDQIASYGEPATIDDFALRAQIVNFVQYRAIFEGYTRNMWTIYSAVLVWKSQNPWTGLRGQFYDYYLDQTGGYFGARKACEPIHVQVNWNDLTFGVINTTSGALTGLSVRYTIYDYLSGTPLATQSQPVPPLAAHAQYISAAPISIPNDSLPIHFIRMVLLDAAGALLSENMYWRSAAAIEDFSAFQRLPPVALSGDVGVSQDGPEYLLSVRISNPAKVVAFFIRLKLLRANAPAGTDDRVLPSFYDDNYFTLLPGETKLLTIRCAQADAGSVPPQLWVAGWNILPGQITARAEPTQGG